MTPAPLTADGLDADIARIADGDSGVEFIAEVRMKVRGAVTPLTIGGTVAVVHLTKGMHCIVDVADWHRVANRPWNASTSRGNVYATRSRYVIGTGRNGKRISESMHREIVGALPSDVVDHRNGNTLDNRRANLRVCTALQNCWNHKRRRGASGYYGVSRITRSTRWQAKIRLVVDGTLRQQHLGSFDDPESAARAFDAVAIKYRGEFATLNFPAEATK